MARLSNLASRRIQSKMTNVRSNGWTITNYWVTVRGYPCTCCGEVIYPNRCDDDNAWNCYWRSVNSNIGYILICPSCSTKYEDDAEVYKKAEEQGWATVCPNGNLRSICSTFLFLHVDKEECHR